ncbi:serine threonine protein kinase [Rhodotorula toruloides]|uniref:Serine threonine protein kinase n=1 Tax=Rhodotorula toruloides TaxID=5286 RepID=A0A511KBE3_RHOTO|nr:serine threonine protein kinase [Rhodotorula toruloides]
MAFTARPAPEPPTVAERFPSELWDHVVAQLPADEVQHTSLALSRALPRTAHVSNALFWRHIRVNREGQAWQIIQKLRQEDGAAEDDPQLLVNLLLALPSLRAISLTVGPLAAPEQLEELLDPAGIKRTGRWKQLEQLAFRFNPYCAERSYYTFLKGAYFDTAPLSLSRLSRSDLPSLRRLSFIQDLPPTHGATKKETPAFGLHELEAELDQLRLEEIKASVPVSGKYGRKAAQGKMEFAQPIVFFQLSCLTRLATSSIGAQLTHLTFRLPRRNLLPSLTDFAPSLPLSPSFPSLKHLDLSTTHVLDDARLPLLLKLHPTLEMLVLDRCSGLISKEAVEEPTAFATLRWLGKCCAGVGLARADDIVRAWRRISKERPADAPNIPASAAVAPSGATNDEKLVPPVRDILVLPPPSRLRSLGLGLHDSLAPHLVKGWTNSFSEGYEDMLGKTVDRAEDVKDRWERWARTNGRLEEGTRRVGIFREAVSEDWIKQYFPQLFDEDGVEKHATHGGTDDLALSLDPDPLFSRFCYTRRLLPLPYFYSPSASTPLVASLALNLISNVEAHAADFAFCPVPDCSNAPGVPHLTLSQVGKEDIEERRKREKEVWEKEKREEWGPGGWRKDESEHRGKCAHLEGHRTWGVERS